MIFNNIQDIKEKIEQGKDESLNSALLYQSYLRVFTESKDVNELSEEDGWSVFLSRFNITDDRKRERIMESLSFPLASVDLTKSASKVVNKLWEAKNRYFNIQDIPESLDEEIKSSEPYEWIKSKAKKVLTNAPCTIVWVDYNEEGSPIYKNIPLESVVCMDVRGCEIDYIAFRSGEYITFLDHQNRIIFEELEDSLRVVAEIQMEYPKAPARFFLDEKVNSSCFKRESLFTDVLGELSDYELFAICHTYTEMYAAFPVIQMPESECNNDMCQSGVITQVNDQGQEYSYECTSCKDRTQILAGTTIKIPAGLDNDIVSPVDVFKFIDPDVKGLTYIKERQEERRNNIYYSTAGVSKVIQKEAINKDQVKAGFDSQKDVLLGIKGQLEELYKWLVNTVIYDNTGDYAEIAANFGTEFFLYTEADLQQLMIQAKDAGTPENEVGEIYRQLVQTKYKQNAYMEKRAFMLNEINPLPFDTWVTVKEKLSLGVISQSDARIWSNFTQLIKRYERDNGDVTLKQLSDIETIKETLILYTDESEQSGSSEESAAS